jgi:hypothetical protein
MRVDAMSELKVRSSVKLPTATADSSKEIEVRSAFSLASTVVGVLMVTAAYAAGAIAKTEAAIAARKIILRMRFLP